MTINGWIMIVNSETNRFTKVGPCSLVTGGRRKDKLDEAGEGKIYVCSE